MKFYMHQRIFSENLIKIELILSAQWRFSEERYQACPVTLKADIDRTRLHNATIFFFVSKVNKTANGKKFCKLCRPNSLNC